MAPRALLLAPLLLLVALVAGETADKRAPLGTMRFGKRDFMDDEMDYSGLDKRSLDEETQTRSIRAPLGTMRFGKRAPLGTMRFGKRSFAEGAPFGTMRFGKRDSLETMRFDN